MTYEEALNWLYAGQQRGIKLGLENMQLLLAALGNPHQRFAAIHIAGTNGKGSVAAMAAALLKEHGWKTGLFTSPHLVDLRERFQINGEMISKEAFLEVLTKIREVVDGWAQQPTFFEIITAIGFYYFARESVDWAVVEVGMGGRLDSTNCILPTVSVITQISLDHQKWLGDTLEAIAREKAGIMKTNVPVITFPQETCILETLEEWAEKTEAPFEIVTQDYKEGPVSLRGEHQRWNAALALRAVEIALSRGSHKAINDPNIRCQSLMPEKVKHALAETVWPGRFQIINNRFVLDGAHNQAAAERLVATWKEVFPGKYPLIIFGACYDKDYALILQELQKLSNTFLFVPINSIRSVNPNVLIHLLTISSDDIHPDPIKFCSLKDAMGEAEKYDGPILITGSLFLIGEALSLLQQQSYPRSTLQ